MTISETTLANALSVWRELTTVNSTVRKVFEASFSDVRAANWASGLAFAFGETPIGHLNLTGTSDRNGASGPVLDAIGVAGDRIVRAHCVLDAGGENAPVVAVRKLSDVASLEVSVSDRLKDRVDSTSPESPATYAPQSARVVLRFADGETIAVSAHQPGRDLDGVLELIRRFNA